MSNFIHNRLVIVLAGVAFLAIGTIAFGTVMSATAVTPDPDRQRSSSLTSSPDVTDTDLVDYYESSDAASEEAGRLANEVPVPQGGNFNGIRWDELGGATRADIKGLLLFNAACQWARARADDRDNGLADAVLSDVPRWPTFRFGDRHRFARALADASGPLWVGVRRDCREIHAREVIYAKARGLPASS